MQVVVIGWVVYVRWVPVMNGSFVGERLFTNYASAYFKQFEGIFRARKTLNV